MRRVEGTDSYDGVAQSSHWLVVLLVAVRFATKRDGIIRRMVPDRG